MKVHTAKEKIDAAYDRLHEAHIEYTQEVGKLLEQKQKTTQAENRFNSAKEEWERAVRMASPYNIKLGCD